MSDTKKLLTVSPSPHIHSGDSTRRIMRDVLIALAPAMSISVWIYGWQTLLITAVAVASCVVFEYLIQRFMLKKPNSVGDLSAVVTGVLLAFNLPSNLPLAMVVLGALVAIGIAKMSFGGIGKNPFNPALVARVCLLLSFPVAMTTFPSPTPDIMSGATPLAFIKESLKQGASMSQIMPQLSYENLLLGIKAGSFGEVSVAALLIGFIYLLIRRVISWHIPVVVLGTMAAVSACFWAADPQHYMNPLLHIITGGAVLGAVFMATDYSTSPMTRKGMVVYGIGIGLLTILIRQFGAYPEGMSFAILIMNAVVPLINKYMRPVRFGTAKN